MRGEERGCMMVAADQLDDVCSRNQTRNWSFISERDRLNYIRIVYSRNQTKVHAALFIIDKLDKQL